MTTVRINIIPQQHDFTIAPPSQQKPTFRPEITVYTNDGRMVLSEKYHHINRVGSCATDKTFHSTVLQHLKVSVSDAGRSVRVTYKRGKSEVTCAEVRDVRVPAAGYFAVSASSGMHSGVLRRKAHFPQIISTFTPSAFPPTSAIRWRFALLLSPFHTLVLYQIMRFQKIARPEGAVPESEYAEMNKSLFSAISRLKEQLGM